MNIIEFINNIKDKRLQTVVHELAKYGIKSNYDPPGSKHSRLLLYSSRYNSRSYALASQCNGLIIDYSTWRVLCHPPELPNLNFSVETVSTNFASYDVSLLADGTVINMYWYLDEWRIATTHGIDVTHMPFRGTHTSSNLTYHDAVCQAMATTTMCMDQLDRSTTYTMNFTHPTMHYTQKLGMQFIRSCCAGDVQTVHADMPSQTQAVFGEFQELQKLCADNAYDGWGFMLRSRDSCTGSSSTVLLESRKMYQVRMLHYDKRSAEQAWALHVDPKNYVFVMALLDKHLCSSYMRWYPLNADLYAAAECEFQRVVAAVTEKNDETVVCWLRDHMDVFDIAQDISDFARNKSHISVWLMHLAKLSLLPSH